MFRRGDGDKRLAAREGRGRGHGCSKKLAAREGRVVMLAFQDRPRPPRIARLLRTSL